MNDLRHVKGLAALGKAMQELPVKYERNVLRGALRAGANVVKPVAQANAPKDTGQMAEGMKVSTRAKGGRVTASIKLTGPHAFLGPWMEFGVAAHTISAPASGWLFFSGGFAKSVEHPGLQPRAFMRPALDSEAGRAVIAAAEYSKKRLASKHGIDTADMEFEEA